MTTTELQSIAEAIQIINAARCKAAVVEFAWKRLTNADKYLQAMVTAHFTE